MNDMLTTMLRDAAAREALPPAPAARVRRHAEQVRNRRRAGIAALGIAAGISAGLVAQGTLSPATWFDPIRPSGRNTATPHPSVTPTPDRSAGVTTPTTAPSSTPDSTDDGSGGTVNTSEPWPAPPTSHVTEPWTKPGFDAGRIVAARMEDGHAVITVDRIQLYSAEQWKTKTGQTIDEDFRTVNESTRTRQFVVDDDALVYVNWQYGDRSSVKVLAQQFVTRTVDMLLQQANYNLKFPPAGGQPAAPPSITVFLFHRDSLDGPVTYIEDAEMYTG